MNQEADNLVARALKILKGDHREPSNEVLIEPAARMLALCTGKRLTVESLALLCRNFWRKSVLSFGLWPPLRLNPDGYGLIGCAQRHEELAIWKDHNQPGKPTMIGTRNLSYASG